MEPKQNETNMQTQAAIDDARLEARRQKILKPAPPNTNAAIKAAALNPTWITTKAPAKSASASSAGQKSARPGRQDKGAGATEKPKTNWKNAADAVSKGPTEQ